MGKMVEHDSSQTRKKKKSKKSGPNAVGMKRNVPIPNPFETIWSRKKFDILGKKRKGEERRIGLARSIAVEKRKKTLLKEYEQSGKASVFLDKRIGEHNEELGDFDKAILRSQRERQLKLGKKSKYNLLDEDEDQLDIYGDSPLPQRDDFEDEMLSDNDDDLQGPKNSSDILKHINDPNARKQLEGGLDGVEGDKRKSKKEVMEEIISKSKFFKAQKARDKEENEQLMEELDKTFASLVQSGAISTLTHPSKMNALKALVNQNIPNDSTKKFELPGSVEFPKQEDQPDSYDKLVKEMVFEMRARPSVRTKAPEEIAQEERERLERLEEERRKRMLATAESSDEESDAHEDANDSSQRQRPISGDDLGDSFSVNDQEVTRKGWVDEILERHDEEDLESGEESAEESAEDDDDEEASDQFNDRNENITSLNDWEQSDEDNISTDLEGKEEAKEHYEEEKEELLPKGHREKNSNAVESKEADGDNQTAIKNKSCGRQPSGRQDSIPYVIEAPNNLEEFCALLEDCSNDDILLVINRIRLCNAIRLKAENRKKMQVFYGVLLQYFAVLADKRPLNLKLLNLLVKPLMEMSTEIPYFAAICARERILRTRMHFCESIKEPGKCSWPSPKTLFLLRLWSLIFPCSDFRHVVMTPAMLLMCEYLMRCTIECGRDVAIGSFLCSMVLSLVKQSRKFCPEAIMFIRTLLMAATDRKAIYSQDSQLYHLMELKLQKPLLCLHGHVNRIHPLDFLMIMIMSGNDLFFSSDNFRASVMVSVIDTLQGFINTYAEFSAFPEIFMPMSNLLLEVAAEEKVPTELQDKLREASNLILKKAGEHHVLRKPLRMRSQRPVPIKLLNPKFEENFVKGRDYDPDRDRAERRKLKKTLKREAKGAARELRKDNYFLLEVKEREKAIRKEEMSEKSGKALAFLQEQEHAFKSGQLGKGRKRRR